MFLPGLRFSSRARNERLRKFVLQYEKSPDSGALRQGEILKGLIEFNVTSTELSGIDSLFSNEKAPPVDRVDHPIVIVLSPDCDLEYDFQARVDPDEPRHKIMTHILLCDLFQSSDLRDDKGVASGDSRRIRSHQNMRYYCINREDPGSIEGNDPLPELYLDFKSPFAIPLDFIMFLIDNGVVKRHGVLPPITSNHLTQRFTSYLGRVSLP